MALGQDEKCAAMDPSCREELSLIGVIPGEVLKVLEATMVILFSITSNGIYVTALQRDQIKKIIARYGYQYGEIPQWVNTPSLPFVQILHLPELSSSPGLPSSLDESGRSWRDRPSLA